MMTTVLKEMKPINARERSRIDTRKRLIENGLKLFSDRGVGETRASDVAAEAGVAVGTLYLHFGDKRGLLRAILFEGIEELLIPLRELAEHPCPDLSAAVRRHTETMVGFAEERASFCRILFDPESVRSGVSTEITEYLVSMQEQRLREGMERGDIPRDLHLTVTARAIVGMLTNVLDWWTRNPRQVSRETLIATLTRLRLSGLYHVV